MASGLMMLYERKLDIQVYCVLPITSIRGKLPVAPVGDTGTVPFSMREYAEEFINVAFDSSERAGGGSQFWFVTKKSVQI
jgi:hypothetical protein